MADNLAASLTQPILRFSSPFWRASAERLYRSRLRATLEPRLARTQALAQTCPLLDPAQAAIMVGSDRYAAVRYLARGTRLVLLGEAGAGKTTLLQAAALALASEPAGLLPVFASLGTYRGGDPLAFLRAKLAAVESHLAALVERFLRTGEAVFFLDGADEIPTDKRETARRAWLALIEEYPRARMIVATGLLEAELWTYLPGAPLTVARIVPVPRHQVAAVAESCPSLADAALLAADADGWRTRLFLALYVAQSQRGAPPASSNRAILLRDWIALQSPDPAQRRELAAMARQLLPERVFPADQGMETALLTTPDGADDWRTFISPWVQDALAATALAELGEESLTWAKRVAQTIWWRPTALQAALATPEICAQMVRRILGVGGDRAILLALACAALHPAAPEATAAVRDALWRRMAREGLTGRWEDASALQDVAGPAAVQWIADTMAVASGVQQAQLNALLGDIGGLVAAEWLATHGLDDARELIAVTASRALEDMGAEAALALATRLHDPKAEIRDRVMDILAQIGAPAVGALMTQLYRGPEQTRVLAANVLARIGAFAVEALFAALRQRNEEVRRAARLALHQMKDHSAIPFLAAGVEDAHPLVRQEAILALGRLGGEEALPYLLRGLRDADKDVRLAALSAFTERTALRAIPALVPLLRDPDGVVRQRTAALLQDVGPSVVEPLLVEFQDYNWDMPGAPTNIISSIGLPAITPLSSVLLDRRWRVRRAAAKALQWIPHPQTVSALATALQDREANVREAAARALGWIRRPEGAAPLMSALHDRNAAVRRAAAWALGELELRPGTGLLSLTEALIAALRDRDSEVREAAVQALGKIGRPAVPPLLEALRSRQAQRARPMIIAALKMIADRSAVPALLEALADTDWHVRQAAAEALGEIGDARAIAPLVRTLGDRHDGPRWAAADALAKLGAPAVPALIEALHVTEWRLRWAAVTALGKIGEPAVLPLLQLLVRGSQEVRWAAEAALAQIGEVAVPALTRALRSSQPSMRAAAAETLAQIDSPLAQEALAKYQSSSWSWQGRREG